MLTEPELRAGTTQLLQHLNETVENDNAISDIHDAFEAYCTNRYAVGERTCRVRTARKNDIGIDCYSYDQSTFHVVQCKVPAPDYLAAKPLKPRNFTPSAVGDAEDALRYLFDEECKLEPCEDVRRLRVLVQQERGRDDFTLSFFLAVYGRLTKRALDRWRSLHEKYQDAPVNLVLHQLDDIAEDFLLGHRSPTGNIEIALGVHEDKLLSQHDYHYFLANAQDVNAAFVKYGWRLFDLNLRGELRNSPVNGEIVKSLRSASSRKRFHHYNNGLIITCKNARHNHGKMTISGAQIVNGLQTVKSVYNAVRDKAVTVDQLSETVRIQVKVIDIHKDHQFVADVARATNNQNPMKPRNLKANSREQRRLRTAFADLQPRWFLQTKDEEWRSLNEENAQFFKAIMGHPAEAFKPKGSTKAGRVIDNQALAKAWLATIGYSDLAGDRTAHYFSKESVYRIAFETCPAEEHWAAFAQHEDFTDAREGDSVVREKYLEEGQASAEQYLFAHLLLSFVRSFIPSPARNRSTALDRGVRAGKLEKREGAIKGGLDAQNAWLRTDTTYQVCRVMGNMKEVLAEAASFVLAKRYGALGTEACCALMDLPDVNGFRVAADIRKVAQNAADASDLDDKFVLSRVFQFLRHCAGQFWEDKSDIMLSTSRLRTLLITPSMIAAFKRMLLTQNERKSLDRSWKPVGVTFLSSLPDL